MHDTERRPAIQDQESVIHLLFFLFPLALSVVATVYFVLGDFGLLTRVFFPIVTILSILLQFVALLRAHVHFLVPFFIQLFVCGCWYVAP